jgi:hypothetical protein
MAIKFGTYTSHSEEEDTDFHPAIKTVDIQLSPDNSDSVKKNTVLKQLDNSDINNDKM